MADKLCRARWNSPQAVPARIFRLRTGHGPPCCGRPHTQSAGKPDPRDVSLLDRESAPNLCLVSVGALAFLERSDLGTDPVVAALGMSNNITEHFPNYGV